MLAKGLDRFGVGQERDVIRFIESFSVLDTRRVQGGQKAMMEVVVLFIQRDPLSYPISEMLV
jgi:hypothetical protein